MVFWFAAQLDAMNTTTAVGASPPWRRLQWRDRYQYDDDGTTTRRLQHGGVVPRKMVFDRLCLALAAWRRSVATGIDRLALLEKSGNGENTEFSAKQMTVPVPPRQPRHQAIPKKPSETQKGMDKVLRGDLRQHL